MNLSIHQVLDNTKAIFRKIFGIWSLKDSLVFRIAFVACLAQATGALLNLNLIHYFSILLAAALFFSLAKKGIPLKLAFPKPLDIAFLALVLILIVQIMIGNGFGVLTGGGYVIIFTLIIYNLLVIGNPQAITIYSWITYLFQFLLLGIVAELIFIITGRQNLLTQLLKSSALESYKEYNPADFIHAIGLAPDAGGANSILLGSQIAGMLCLLAFIWFLNADLNKGGLKKYIHPIFPWLLLAFTLLITTINGAVAFMACIGLCAYFIVIYRSTKKIAIVIALVILFAILYGLVSNGYVFARIFSGNVAEFSRDVIELFKAYQLQEITKDISVLDYYLFTFLRPVDLWSELNLINQIFGAGGPYFLDENIYISGDFGFGAEVLLKSGFAWCAIFSSFIIFSCINGMRVVKTMDNAFSPWANLRMINSLCVLLWFASLIHYPPAIQNTGAIYLFAMQLALIFYSNQQMSLSK